MSNIIPNVWSLYHKRCRTFQVLITVYLTSYTVRGLILGLVSAFETRPGEIPLLDCDYVRLRGSIDGWGMLLAVACCLLYRLSIWKLPSNRFRLRIKLFTFAFDVICEWLRRMRIKVLHPLLRVQYFYVSSRVVQIFQYLGVVSSSRFDVSGLVSVLAKVARHHPLV